MYFCLYCFDVNILLPTLLYCIHFNNTTTNCGSNIFSDVHHMYNNKDEVNRPNILSDRNYQASSKKFRQINSYQDLFLYLHL